MIRKLKDEDIESVMDIWFNGNMQAHWFINEKYWRKNYEIVCRDIKGSDVRVYEKDGKIAGFIGLNDDYIAGIFVACGCRSEGIGKELINFAKTEHRHLSLAVYEKNARAISFYKREGFSIEKIRTDKDTGETEFLMEWNKRI